jgi:hypothetical protein
MALHWHRTRERARGKPGDVCIVWLRHHVEQSHRTVRALSGLIHSSNLFLANSRASMESWKPYLSYHGINCRVGRATHTSRFYGGFPWVSKFTPMVFQDNLGWPFTPHLKWIFKYKTVAWIPPRFPPAGQRQMTSTNTCFIHHCPNQLEHHATCPRWS